MGRFQKKSKYPTPHQNVREMSRRVRQAARGQIQLWRRDEDGRWLPLVLKP